MIQDIFPHHLNNSFIQGKEPSGEDLVLCLKGDRVFLLETEGSGGMLRFPNVSEYPEVRREYSGGGQMRTAPDGNLQYLFTVDDTALFLDLKVPSEDEEFTGGGFFSVRRDLRGTGRLEPEWVFAAHTAYHLSVWYRDNRHCGRCGCAVVPAKDERAVDCPSCHNRIYPRINPAVIVGVTNQDKLLITRYADRPLSVDALVAGFTEIGETFEETVAREVMEEAGLHVKNIRYYKSQPWGMASDILAGFFCDVDGDPQVHLDRHELKSALWIPREEIKGQPDNLSLTNEMMLLFRDGKEPHFDE